MRTGRKYTNWILRFASLLLCLVLLSLYMLSGLWAKYVSTDSGSDNARVASFHVTEEGLDVTIDAPRLSPGGEKLIAEVKLTSNSETSVRFQFNVEVDGNLPLQIDYELDGVRTNGTDTWSADVASNDATDKKFSIYVRWPESENSYIFENGVASIQIKVEAAQID